MAELVVVAGATGHLGSAIVHALRARGLRVRAAGRNRDALQRFAGLPGVEICVADFTHESDADAAVHGAAMVVSAMGASVSILRPNDARGLTRSDLQANRTLIAAAQRAHVAHFLYVSVFHDTATSELAYVRVHRQVEEALRASNLGAVIVQPTGFYYALAEMRGAAAYGFLPRFGDGLARTNPIDEAELAHFCVEALLRGPGTYPVGGPHVMTRADILRALLRSVGRAPRLLPVPVWMMRVLAMGLRWVHPRLGHLLTFFAVVSTHDCVAPPYGQRRFEAYLQQLPKV